MSPPSDLITIVIAVPRDELRRRGREGARRLHERHDPRETTRAGRAAFFAAFERAADPDGALSPEERAHRAQELRSEHFRRLGRLSAAARAARGAAPRAEGVAR